MNAIRIVNASLLVIVFTAWALSGVAAQRIVTPEQAAGDAVVEALDGPRPRLVPAVYPAAPAVPAQHQDVARQEAERARLADYVDLHRGNPIRNTNRLQARGL